MTYEQVVKIQPQPGKPRPIMLVGPRGGPFDMETLSASIVQSNPQRFGTPIKREEILWTISNGCAGQLNVHA